MCPVYPHASLTPSPQVRTSLGPRTAAYFALLTAAQFHVPFYASRFLPNTFALILCNLASAEWIHGKHPLRVVYLMAFTVVVVRCDAALLAGPVRCPSGQRWRVGDPCSRIEQAETCHNCHGDADLRRWGF